MKRHRVVFEQKASAGASVCLPVYNAARFIAPTIDSVLAQTHPDFELIITDDASTDDTAGLCAAYAARDQRIRLYRNPRRVGWVRNVNGALAKARGAYITLMSHDDELDPRFISALAAALDADPDAAGAFCDMHVYAADRQVAVRSYDKLEGTGSASERGIAVIKNGGPWWTCYRSLIRRGTIEKTGGLRTHWGSEFSADWAWVLQLALAGKLVRVPEALYIKNRGGLAPGLSRTWNYGVMNQLGIRLSFYSVIRQSDLSPAQARPVHAAVTRSIYKLLDRSLRERVYRLRQGLAQHL